MPRASLGFVAVALAAVLLIGGCEHRPVEPDTLQRVPTRVRTYRDGSRLFLEVVAGRDTARVGLEERWGASIVEASLNGTNFVNAFDPGREIQMSLYDGDHHYDTCAGCRGIWGWNPVQGGDRSGNGSTVLESRLDDDELFVRVRPNHWLPDNKGGGWGRPVGADLVLEQRISPVEGHPHAFHIEYTIEHQGLDSHALTSQQEFPAIYVNREFDRFVHYEGLRPWTHAPVSISQLPPLFSQPGRRDHSAEWWAAFVNRDFQGLTVYTPGSYPYFTSGYQAGETGPSGSGANYTHPFTPFGLRPRARITGDVYVILGDVRAARRTVYDLHRRVPPRDLAFPMGEIELSHAVATIGQTLTVSGWAFDNLDVQRIEVLVKDSVVGVARSGLRRSEVRRMWPGAPLDAGYEFRLDTQGLPTGPHAVRVRVSDAAGNVLERAALVRLRN